MIGTLLSIAWTNLKRDRVALLLTFVLPLGFFSIFAAMFGGGGGGGPAAEIELDAIAVDLDDSEISRDFLGTLGAEGALALVPRLEVAGESPRPYTREEALEGVRGGRHDAAIVIPAGFGASFGNFGGDGPPVEVIYDASNPIAQHAIAGLIQAAAFNSSPGALMKGGFAALEQFGGAMTPAQQAALGELEEAIEQGQAQGGESPPGSSALVQIEATAAHQDEGGETRSMIAYYAAGIGVMFLLFSMTGAAGGLLEQEESGTLERLLTSNVGMGRLLLSNWLFFGLMGLGQVCLMFVWGAVGFGLDLWQPKRLAGFFVMAVVTAAAAAAFGLVLATLCKTRGQLGGISTIVILVMSALGGSMVPRFLMPEFMNSISRLTFNGWALDGFLKVFWYDDPEAGMAAALADLLPQIAVLGGLTVLFLLAARALARRWEVT